MRIFKKKEIFVRGEVSEIRKCLKIILNWPNFGKQRILNSVIMNESIGVLHK